MRKFLQSSSSVSLNMAERHKQDNNNPTRLLLGLATVALGQALQNGSGYLTAPALLWLTLAVLCSAGAILSLYFPFPALSRRELWLVLGGGLIWQIAQLLTCLPGYYLLPQYYADLWIFRLCVAAAALFALLSLISGKKFPKALRPLWIVLTFACMLAAGIWVIHTAPQPVIDTFMFQQTSSRALLEGKNPYQLTEPNIYGNMDNYGPAWVKDGKMTLGNPYPPLSILLSLTGYMTAGDIRYTHLLAVLLAGGLMLTLHPARENLLAAYLFLFTPRLFFVIEQSWSEPLVLLLCVWLVYCAVRQPKLTFLALGLMLAIKQYMILLLPLSLLLSPSGVSPKHHLRLWAKAVGVAFIVTAPLAFWNFSAFLWNVGLAQFYQVFRANSLSYAALYSAVSGAAAWQFLPFILLALVYLFIRRFAHPSPAGFAAALAFALLLFVAFSQQAFCNYYFLVIGLLCCALAACDSRLAETAPEM